MKKFVVLINGNKAWSVGEGVRFSNGRAVVCWMWADGSIVVYESMKDIKEIPGMDNQEFTLKWD